MDACGVELGCIHAGEHGNREQARGTGGSRGFSSGGHHDWATGGVKCEKGSSSLRGGADGSGHGVGDVVELEIEEDVEAAVAERLDESVAGGVVKLHAYLEPSAAAGELVYKIEGGFGGREVEG